MTALAICRALSCGKQGCLCGLAARRGQGVTHCPTHADGTPSLSVSKGKHVPVVIHCHASCPQDAVVAALKERGLWADAPEPLPVTRYSLHDREGVAVAVHCRQDQPGGKRVWWEQPDGTTGLNGVPVTELPLYGAHLLRPDVIRVVLTEGEKAAESLLQRGIQTAGTVTGAATIPGPESLRALSPHMVYLWPDNDEPGRAHMTAIAHQLEAWHPHSTLWVSVPDANPGDDAADYEGDVVALLNTARCQHGHNGAGGWEREPEAPAACPCCAGPVAEPERLCGPCSTVTEAPVSSALPPVEAWE